MSRKGSKLRNYGSGPGKVDLHGALGNTQGLETAEL